MKTRTSRPLTKMLLATLILAVWSLPASAQSSSREGSEIVFSPYLWMTALNGTSTVGALPPLDIDASFSDIFSNLNFAASIHTEFRNGPWTFVLDPMYVSIEAGIDGPLPGDANPKVGVDMWFVEAWAGYQFTDHWEVLGGARYQDQDLTMSGLPSPPLPVSSIGVKDDWTDWFVGVRFTTDMGEKWFLSARLDAVVTGDSDSSTNAIVMLNRRFGTNKSLNLGYRYFVDDYDNLPTYAWDMTQDGPIVGFTWAF